MKGGILWLPHLTCGKIKDFGFYILRSASKVLPLASSHPVISRDVRGCEIACWSLTGMLGPTWLNNCLFTPGVKYENMGRPK